jgi:thiosulfate dehydrogenase
MKTCTQTTHRVDRLTLAGTVMALCFSVSALAAQDANLDKVIRHGKDLFTHATFGGSGRVCETCHISGGTVPGHLPDGKPIPSLNNAAAIFPRFKERLGRVVTLEDQVRSCTGAALEGTPPAYGSEELNALVTYVTSLSQGKPLDMGGKPQ